MPQSDIVMYNKGLIEWMTLKQASNQKEERLQE